MNDKELMNMLAEISVDIKPDFASLMKRIEAQTGEERSSTRREALALQPAAAKQGMSSSARRTLAAAAAIVVTLGLGTVLIATSLFGGMAKSDTAYYESDASEAVCEEAMPMEDDYYENASSETTATSGMISEEGAYDDQPVEPTEPVSDSDAVDEPTPVEEEKVSAPPIDAGGYVQQTVSTAGMTIELPADAYITGRSVANDFPLLGVYDISAAQLEANYKQRGIYCNALWYDDAADISEIVVTVSEDADSRRIFNLKKAGSYTVSRLENLYYQYSADGGVYNDVSTVETGQALFFRAMGTLDNADGRSNHLQYMTIINGKRIEITLIEHFGIDAPTDGSEPEDVSSGHQELMERVVDSARWKVVKSGFLTRSRGVIFYSVITLAAIVSIVVVLLSQKKKSRADALQSAAKEPDAGDDGGDKEKTEE